MGLAAIVIEQIISLPIYYYEYNRVSYDKIKRRDFYKIAIVDFLFAELFFCLGGDRFRFFS